MTRPRKKKKKTPVLLSELVDAKAKTSRSGSPLPDGKTARPKAEANSAQAFHRSGHAYQYVSANYHSPLKQRWIRIEKQFPLVGKIAEGARVRLQGYAEFAEGFTQSALKLAKKRLPKTASETLTRWEIRMEALWSKTLPFLNRKPKNA